jgi:hypothetical protein
MTDILSRLRQHFDVDRCMQDPAFVIEVYRDERVEAAREIEALRKRLSEVGVSTAGDLPEDPKVVRLLR